MRGRDTRGAGLPFKWLLLALVVVHAVHGQDPGQVGGPLRMGAWAVDCPCRASCSQRPRSQGMKGYCWHLFT